MGIPFYFSSIIQQYPQIIQKLVSPALAPALASAPAQQEEQQPIKINNFFLDSNSICYDCARRINYNENMDVSTYAKIIRAVISKIEEYISIVKPDNLVMIALDGTPPVAKLQQQRERRYKAWYTAELIKNMEPEDKKAYQKMEVIDPFNTVEITTGTKFMAELNAGLLKHFGNPDLYGVKTIIVSTSDEPGEGEAKIYEFIRTSGDIEKDSATMVYGLDADLIMLSINHLPVCPNIFLFRETPEFIKSIDSSLEPNENYMLDIPQLCDAIIANMKSSTTATATATAGALDAAKKINRVYDYIFLCFFLGNDFLPHFPAINIRTGGIDKLMNAYKATIADTPHVLTDGKTIYWKQVRKLVLFLAEKEEEYICDEMKLRAKKERIRYPSDTLEQKKKRLDAIPTYERDLEKYIDPFKPNWEWRYYRALFNTEMNAKHDEDTDEDEDAEKKRICTNYLEGLEWTFKYYTHGCPDWRWRYKYHYPPLLTDLIKYIPYFETEFVKQQTKNPISQMTQLCYVLPRPSLQLLPESIYKNLIKEHVDWYGIDYDFIWAYCKYFWEAHVLLPEIDLDELDRVARLSKR